jgi:Rha family phage regulatory protein
MQNQVIVTVSDNNTLTTTSKNISEVFGKQHRNVVQSIDNLLPDLPSEWGVLNFQQGYYTMPETGNQQHRMFNITRDGFTLLAMGFTGKKALTFKLAYIDQFNKMEQALLAPTASLSLVQTLNDKVAEIESHYQRQLAHIRQENTQLYRQLLVVQQPEPVKALPSVSQTKAQQYRQDRENEFVAKVKTALDSEGKLMKHALLAAVGKPHNDKTARALLDKFDGVFWKSEREISSIFYTLIGGGV